MKKADEVVDSKEIKNEEAPEIEVAKEDVPVEKLSEFLTDETNGGAPITPEGDMPSPESDVVVAIGVGEPQEVMPEMVEEPKAPEEEKPAEKTIPFQAYEKERKKRQELEKRVREYEAVMTDAQVKQMSAEEQATFWKSQHDQAKWMHAVDIMERDFAAENPDYEDVAAQFMELAQEYPVLIEEARNSENPAEYIYNTMKEIASTDEPVEEAIADVVEEPAPEEPEESIEKPAEEVIPPVDIEKLKQDIRAEIEAEMAAKNVQIEPEKELEPPVIPATFRSSYGKNAGGEKSPASGNESPISKVFGRKK